MPNPDHAIGLCATCRHTKRLESSRGSVFHMCQLAETNPQYARYPRLPVRECPGYADALPPPDQPRVN